MTTIEQLTLISQSPVSYNSEIRELAKCAASELSQRDEVIRELREFATETKSMLDDSVLVRDISEDHNFTKYMAQGIRVTKWVDSLNKALALKP